PGIPVPIHDDDLVLPNGDTLYFIVDNKKDVKEDQAKRDENKRYEKGFVSKPGLRQQKCCGEPLHQREHQEKELGEVKFRRMCFNHCHRDQCKMNIGRTPCRAYRYLYCHWRPIVTARTFDRNQISCLIRTLRPLPPARPASYPARYFAGTPGFSAL